MLREKISFIEFYERRARRILPALFLVIFSTLPFAWYSMNSLELKDFSESLVATPLFISNILFYKTSGYFDIDSELRPLIHTWSLAVEEQFYILFPLLLALVWKMGRKKVIFLFILLTFFSIFVAEYGQKNYPLFSFYMLPTRCFEILIGALASFHVKKEFANTTRGALINNIVSIMGLLLILFSIFAFGINTPSPSAYSLIPTIGQP